MATSLRDIPGASRDRRRRSPLTWLQRRREWRPGMTPHQGHVELGPRSLRLGRARSPKLRQSPMLGSRRQFDIGLIAVWLLFIAMGAVGAKLLWSATRVDVDVAGVRDGAAMTPAAAAQLQVTLTFDRRDDLQAGTLTFDGVDVVGSDEPDVSGVADVGADTIVWTPPVELTEGGHRLRLSVPRIAFGASTFTWDFTVDGTAPMIELPATFDPVPVDEPVRIDGRIEDGAELTVAGEPVETAGGRFHLAYDRPPAGPVDFVAVDAAGNTATASIVVPVLVAPVHGVHVTAAGWADDGLRQGIVGLIDAGLIDTVELDLKDESGVIGYASNVERARAIGAVRPEFDLVEAVRFLEGRGVRVVGRIVAFRDPIYATAAWAEGHTEQVVQAPDGQPLAAYGGFTNYVDPAVRQYNIDIALEAVDLGVDSILWDYVRRPEGAPETMIVPGLGDRTTSMAMADFLAQAHEALRAEGAVQGASVFGIAADRPGSIGQDIPTLSRHVDYLSPMVYPSHFVDGEYRVESPIHQPGEIVAATLADFQAKADGSGVRFVPWLQDFTLYDVAYGPAEVRAQIDAALSLGIDGFLLWNAGAVYTAEALLPLGG